MLHDTDEYQSVEDLYSTILQDELMMEEEKQEEKR